MKMKTSAASAIVLSSLVLSACVRADDQSSACIEPEPGMVLREGVYEKYDDPNIVAREEPCKPVVKPVAKPVVPNDGNPSWIVPFIEVDDEEGNESSLEDNGDNSEEDHHHEEDESEDEKHGDHYAVHHEYDREKSRLRFLNVWKNLD